MEQAGHRVWECSDGKQACQVFRDYQPDVVFLDAIMPQQNGFITCQQLRRLPGGDYPLILIITSLEDADSVDQAFEMGADDFMLKPVHPIILRRRILHLLKLRRPSLPNIPTAVQIGSWELDLVRNRVQCSGEVWNQAEITYDLFIRQIAPEDQIRFIQALDAAIYDEKIFSLDHGILYPDGRNVPVHSQATVIRNADGWIVRVLATMTVDR